MVDRGWDADWHAPVVAETYDGALNDINGQHVSAEHVFDALKAAEGGVVTEGSVGGGTGMICNGFKGGIGTASRKFIAANREYIVGVLVQCNYNWEGDDLRIGGRRVTDALPVNEHCHVNRGINRSKDWYPYCDNPVGVTSERTRDGSIIVVIATNAPLMPHQLSRLAKRPSLALGRLGAISNDGSGDIFIAFSTGNSSDESAFASAEVFPNNVLSVVFRAAVDATKEAIVNAMVAAETMVGADGLRVNALPHGQLKMLFQSPSD
jgi:L-aminopeptidase/D-esterase-like protein